VLLISFRATRGQKSLINSITQNSKPPVQWQSNTATLQWQTKSTQQAGGLTPRMVRAVGLPPGSFPDVAAPTDADAGRTDVSVDPARRTARTPSGRPSRRRRQRPRRRPTALRLTLQPLSRRQRRQRPRCRPTVPVPSLVSANRRTSPAVSADTPAVAYDGDLDVSRRTLAPGLVRRADAAPCVLLTSALTTLMSSEEPQFPADSGGSTHVAKLHFAEQVTQTLRFLS